MLGVYASLEGSQAKSWEKGGKGSHILILNRHRSLVAAAALPAAAAAAACNADCIAVITQADKEKRKPGTEALLSRGKNLWSLPYLSHYDNHTERRCLMGSSSENRAVRCSEIALGHTATCTLYIRLETHYSTERTHCNLLQR